MSVFCLVDDVSGEVTHVGWLGSRRAASTRRSSEVRRGCGEAHDNPLRQRRQRPLALDGPPIGVYDRIVRGPTAAATPGLLVSERRPAPGRYLAITLGAGPAVA